MSISRRKFFRASASAAGAGVLLGTGLSTPMRAAEGNNWRCPALPQPIPHTIATPFGTTIHHFFPGPVEGTDPVTGHDPSEIFDFHGMVAQADVLLAGTGTDLNTGDNSSYGFHTDMRFMAGQFRGTDGKPHTGAFAFI